MASENTIIIDVEVNASEAGQKLSEATARIAALKQQQRKLAKQIKSGADVTGELSQQYAKNSQEIKDLTAQEKMYTAQLNVTTQGNTKLGDSYIEMSRTLAALKQDYRGLSEEQRKSEGGQELLKNIQDLDQQMKSADASMGDYQRNVGNYQSALEGMGGKAFQVAKMFQGGFKNALQAAGQALKSFGKTLLTTPVGWIAAGVAAVVAAFKQLREAFKRNDEASTRMAAAMARMQPIITAVKNAFNALADGIASVVDWGTKLITKLFGSEEAFNRASDAAAEYQIKLDELEEAERQFSVAKAQAELSSAAYMDAALNNTKESLETRIGYLEAAKEEEEKILKGELRLAQQNLDLLKQQQQQEADYSDEMAQKIADAYVRLVNAGTAYYEGTRRLSRRITSFREEQAREAQAAAQTRIEAKKTELEEIRKLEDLAMNAITDITDKELAQTEASYNRQIEDLQRRLDTEKNLTTAAREAINQQILLLEAELQRRLQAIRDAASEEERQKALEAAQANYDAQMQFAKENEELIKAQMANAFDNLQMKLNESLLKAGENARLQNEAQLQYAQSYLDQLNNMNAEQAAAMFENYQAYQLAVQQAEQAVMDAQRSSQEALQQQVNEVGSTMQAVTGSLSSLFEAAAEDSESYEKFKKAMAIVDAMISMATTIAAATTASTEGDPYTMAIRIAANVAAVTAQFAAVIKAIKAATIPSAGSFAEGGIVPGNSYTGDRMVAHTNSGEMILTRQMQLEMLKLLANGVPSSAFNYNRMKEAFTEALQEQKAPVLVYSEFEDFNNRRKKIQSITRL